MVRKILTLILISLSAPCFANFSESAPQGFHWYTSDTRIVMKEPKQEVSITHTVTMAPHQQLKYLSLTTKDTLAVAILHPSVEHTAQYMRAQQWWAKHNQKFVRNWQQALLEYPDLDYSLRFPTDNTAIPVRNDEHKLLVERTIDTMSKHYGLIFFYRGNSSICQKFVSILAPFVKARHFAMISVTTDHQPSTHYWATQSARHSNDNREARAWHSITLLTGIIFSQFKDPSNEGIELWIFVLV